jgi:flagellar basal-body rod modification protein FlgD
MDVSPLAQTQPTGASAPASGSFAQSDYLTFLRMLTVQMQNQDPLNPMSSSDFAVQLATFSGVEQQTQTNQLLQSMLGRMGLADLGGWVGMEVLSAEGAWFDGAPVALDPNLPQDAERGLLLIRNPAGSIVDTIEVAPGTRDLSWDGRTLEGAEAPHGQYSFTLESYRGGELLDAVPVAAYQRVTEARRGDAGIELVLSGGVRLDSAAVIGLRRPAEG